MLSRSLYATRIRSTSPISDCICKFAEGRPVCVCPDLCVQVDGHALQLGGDLEVGRAEAPALTGRRLPQTQRRLQPRQLLLQVHDVGLDPLGRVAQLDTRRADKHVSDRASSQAVTPAAADGHDC